MFRLITGVPSRPIGEYCCIGTFVVLSRARASETRDPKAVRPARSGGADCGERRATAQVWSEAEAPLALLAYEAAVRVCLVEVMRASTPWAKGFLGDGDCGPLQRSFCISNRILQASPRPAAPHATLEPVVGRMPCAVVRLCV